MNTSEWIMLIQTLVLAATGFIVYWYTKETQKIRRETSNQNSILAEQLRVLKQQALHEEKKEKSLLEPVFIYNGGGSNSDGVQIKLINKGAVVRNIEVKNLALGHRLSYKNILESDKEIVFYFNKFKEDLPEQMDFIIEYENKLGEKWQKEMILNTKKKIIVEKTS